MTATKSIFLLLFAFLSLASCGGGKSDSKGGSYSPEKTPDRSVKILNGDGSAAATIDIKAGAISLDIAGTKIVSEMKGDKRKYGTPSGETLFEVKYNDGDKLKLRRPDGSLLWKVKIDSDKIKVSNNEENENAFKIKRYDDKIKTKAPDETEIGDVRPKGEQLEVASAGKGYTINTKELSQGYGMLLIPDLGERERFILVAELLARNL